MKRVLAAVIGLIASAAMLVGCSDDKGSSAPTTAAPAATAAAAGDPVASTGGASEVKVEGAIWLAWIRPRHLCQAGRQDQHRQRRRRPQQGLGLVMTDEATPVVRIAGPGGRRNALAVANNMGVKSGSAEVTVDGDTYTITGEAQGADMKNPMAGMITKKFEIKVSCS